MLSAEQLERLARYQAGALTAEEHASLERELARSPELRAGLDQLAALDAAARALPTELAPAHVAALVERSLPRATPGVRTPWLVSAAALIALLGGLGWALRPAVTPTHVVAVTGPVTADGRQLGAGEALLRPSAVRTSASGNAVLTRAGSTWLIPSGAELSLDSTPTLARGVVVVHGVADLEAGGVRVGVDGLAVIAMEPVQGESRVTRQLEATRAEDVMKAEWLKLGAVGATMAALGSAVTVVVMRGSAAVTAPGGPPVTVSAGEAWRPGAAPARVSANATAPASPEDDVAQAGATAGDPGRADYAALSREQLIAQAEALRDQKEQLLAERAELRKRLQELEHPVTRAANYYRFDPDELAASARQGELRLRGPQLGERPVSLSRKLRDSVGLSEEEEKLVEEAFAGSTRRAKERLAAIYREIGGDPRAAETLSSQGLLSELRDKALPGDFEAAVRQLANERAGLTAAMDPSAGSAILRALRALVSEDARVLDELDRMLGPRRAEALLNNAGFPHHDSTFGVGPAPKP